MTGTLLLLGTAEGVRPVPTVLYAMAGPAVHWVLWVLALDSVP
jgi:hypothetical protein